VLYRVYVGRVEPNTTVSAGWILIARRPDVGVSGTRGRRDVNVESPSYSEFCQLPEVHVQLKEKALDWTSHPMILRGDQISSPHGVSI
jgi:hypothetical protein